MEFSELARAILDLLDVAERRTDLSVLEDLERLAALGDCLGALASRIDDSVGRRIAAEGGSSRALRAPSHAQSTLAGPAAQSAIAEAFEFRPLTSADELAMWMRGSRTADTDPRRQADGADGLESKRVPIVAPEATQAALREAVGPGVTMEGLSRNIPIAKLFAFLADTRQTGCLHLRRTDEYLRFVFVEGVVVASTTSRTHPDELLGELLVQSHQLTPERRTRLVELARSRRKSFGAVAVAERDVTILRLSEALSAQVQARFERVYQDRDLAYAFVPSAGELSDGRVRVNARWLLFESARTPQGLGAEPIPDHQASASPQR